MTVSQDSVTTQHHMTYAASSTLTFFDLFQFFLHLAPLILLHKPVQRAMTVTVTCHHGVTVSVVTSEQTCDCHLHVDVVYNTSGVYADEYTRDTLRSTQ